MNGDHQGYYQFRRKLTAGYVILATLLFVLLAWKIAVERRAEKESAVAITGVTANSMGAHVAEFLDAVDQPLRASASALSVLTHNTISAETVRPILAASSMVSDSRFWIVFVDVNGVGVVASNGLPVSGVSFADRPYFRAALSAHAGEYFLGVRASGCACVGCTVASSSGPRWSSQAGRSAPSNGGGSSPEWTGSACRRPRWRSGGCEDVNCLACKRRPRSLKCSVMDLLNELARTDIDPALLAQVQALIAQQQAKLAQQDTVLAENDFKIKALTFELAYYKRVRFGKAGEALVGEQRMLFDET